MAAGALLRDPRRRRRRAGDRAACGKHKESLIVVNLTTATPITNPGPVTLTVGSLSREYSVAALSSTPVLSASTSRRT